MKLNKKKKKMLTIAVSAVFVLIIAVMLFRNYRRARNAEDAFNSQETQESLAMMKEFNEASVQRKAEILNQTMSAAAAKTQAEAFWALAKGVTNKKKEKLISEWVIAIPTSADFTAISKAYSDNGMGRGGRSLSEQITYELKPAKTYQAALKHLADLASGKL